MEPEGSKTFCSAAWMHLHVANDGSIEPCCAFSGTFGSVGKHALTEIWNGRKFGKLRKRLLAGKQHAGCQHCYEAEANGIYSHRQRMNHDFGSLALARIQEHPNPRQTPPPISFDIRFSNLCNFRCRMCFHGSSSRWYSEAKSLGETAGPRSLIRGFATFADAAQELEPFLDDLSHVYFAGGEPLITPEHYSLLSYLLERGRNDVWLSYNSNLSHLALGETSVLDLWNAFAKVDLEASIDGVGELGELVRKDLDWSAFRRNIKTVQERCPHVRIKYGVTALILNVFHLPQMIAEITNDLAASPGDWRIHPLSWPPYYSVRVLPVALKTKASEMLRAVSCEMGIDRPPRDSDRFPERPPIGRQIETLIGFMHEADWSHLLPKFRARTRALDQMRGEATASLVPELERILDPA